MTAPSHRIIVRPKAEADIIKAAVWYHRQQPGLADDFIAEIESAIVNAAENPFRFPCFRRRPEVRRVLLNRFPYRLFFFRLTDSIVIFRVLHGARHDREWKSHVDDV